MASCAFVAVVFTILTTGYALRTPHDVTHEISLRQRSSSGAAAVMEAKIIQLYTKFDDADIVKAESKYIDEYFIEHGNTGGDRMDPKKHNYASIYAKHLVTMQEGAPTIVETGILRGSGLAMWSELFPTSMIYGFDLKTETYQSNLGFLKTHGFDDSRVVVQNMDQRNNNTEYLRGVFGNKIRPAVVIDDGFHTPNAGSLTFRSFQPFLADKFVYFIEDIPKRQIDSGAWIPPSKEILKTCVGCDFDFECPAPSIKQECIAVISRL